MGNIRWGKHLMGETLDGGNTRWGNTRWGKHEMGETLDGGNTRWEKH